MAPSRFVPNASGASTVSANRLAKMMLAAKIGKKLITIAVNARSGTSSESSQLDGTSQLSARPTMSTPYITGSGGVRHRCVTSTAASTATSTPAKTSEFTTHVVPKNSAKPVTLLVSINKNAAPSRNRSR